MRIINQVTLLIICLFTFITTSLQAQNTPPQLINYQAVAHDQTGAVLDSQMIYIKVSIINSNTGNADYSEEHTVTTNKYGLFSLLVGDGSPIGPSFSNINWESYNYELEISLGSSSGSLNQLASDPLVTVPYAFHAETVKHGDNWGTDVVNVSGANISGNGTTANPLIVIDNDTSSNNEIQALTILGDTIYLSNNGGTVILPSSTGDNWGTDVVNVSGANISGDGTSGNPLIVIDNDTSANNEIQDLHHDTITNILTITNNPSANSINLGLYKELPATGSAVPNQVLTWSGSQWILQSLPAATNQDLNNGGKIGNDQTINITSGSSATFSVADADSSTANEIQTLSFANPDLNLSNGGGTVNLSSLSGPTYTAGTGIDLTGNQITNTAPDQTVSISGSGASTVTGTYPNFTVNSTDNQDLSINVNTLSLTNDPTTVDLSSFMDNTDAQTLTYDPVSQDLAISGGNNVTLNVNDGDWTIGTNSGIPVIYNTTDLVGINTSTPTSLLTIKEATAGTQIGILNSADQPRHDLKINGGDDAVYQMYDNNGSMEIQLFTNGPTFFNGGNVGIGTGSPDELFHVHGNSGNEGVALFESDNDYTAISINSNTANDGGGVYFSQWNDAYLGYFGGNYFTSTGDTNTFVGVGDPRANNSNPELGLSVSSSDKRIDLRLYKSGTDTREFKMQYHNNTSSSLAMLISDTIYFRGGQNFNDPTEFFISGKTTSDELIAYNAFKYQNGANNGYILQTDNNGNATWVDPASISTAADGDWTINGTDLYTDLGGHVSIGTNRNNIAGYQLTSAGTVKKEFIISANNGSTTIAPAILALEGSSSLVGDEIGVIDFINSSQITEYNFARIAATKENSNNTYGALRFYTRKGAALTEQMMIDEDGNVGLGTSSANTKLHVVGDTRITGTTSTQSLTASADIFVGGIVKRSATGTADMLALAYGNIKEDGTILNSSNNITSIYNSNAFPPYYDIQVYDDNGNAIFYEKETFITNVTCFADNPSGWAPEIWIPNTSDDGNGKLRVYLWSLDTAEYTYKDFSFVIYKP